jgi:chemotaxis protein MotB
MKRPKKQAEPDSGPGAPEWMVTFSDCMTLLLTFFVLLLSFASFDKAVFSDLKVIYSDALTRITPTPQMRQRDSISHIPQIKPVTSPEKGSETPTTAQQLKNALMEEMDVADLQKGMVFLIPSKKVYWGQGVTVSREGRSLINLMASFLEKVPGRIVVSETGALNEHDNRNFGLPRAWAVMEYLTKSQGLDRNRFCISMTGIVARSTSGNETSGLVRDTNRTVEISVLELNTYN